VLDENLRVVLSGVEIEIFRTIKVLDSDYWKASGPPLVRFEPSSIDQITNVANLLGVPILRDDAPSKIAWSPYDINGNSLVLAEWLGLGLSEKQPDAGGS